MFGGEAMSEALGITLILLGTTGLTSVLIFLKWRLGQDNYEALEEDLRSLEVWWTARRRGEKLPEPQGPLIPKRRVVGMGVYLLCFVALLGWSGYVRGVPIPFMLVILSLLTAYGSFRVYRAWTGRLRDDPEPEEATEAQPEK